MVSSMLLLQLCHSSIRVIATCYTVPLSHCYSSPCYTHLQFTPYDAEQLKHILFHLFQSSMVNSSNCRNNSGSNGGESSNSSSSSKIFGGLNTRNTSRHFTRNLFTMPTYNSNDFNSNSTSKVNSDDNHEYDMSILRFIINAATANLLVYTCHVGLLKQFITCLYHIINPRNKREKAAVSIDSQIVDDAVRTLFQNSGAQIITKNQFNQVAYLVNEVPSSSSDYIEPSDESVSSRKRKSSASVVNGSVRSELTLIVLCLCYHV
jgi:hypothetical protein